MPESTTEPTLALTLHEILVYLFPEIKYTHIQTIHTYTYIYIQYMQYMHIQPDTGTYISDVSEVALNDAKTVRRYNFV